MVRQINGNSYYDFCNCIRVGSGSDFKMKLSHRWKMAMTAASHILKGETTLVFHHKGGKNVLYHHTDISPLKMNHFCETLQTIIRTNEVLTEAKAILSEGDSQ